MSKSGKLKAACAAILLAALCAACGAAEKESGEGSPAPESTVTAETTLPADTETAAPESREEKTEAPVTTAAETATETETEPATEAPAETAEEVILTRSSYRIAEGTAEENEVIVISSNLPGPAIYIVGGIHGDELAGWHTANRLKDELQIRCGTVYILSPANQSGAAAEQRFVVDSGDLNRVFPGDAESEDIATRIAASIFGDIKDKMPDLLLDLHEARLVVGGENPAGLANCLIYTDDTKIRDILFDFMIMNDAGGICSARFALTTPGKTGSINRVVTDTLGIPSVTTETHRKSDLEVRIADQLEIVYYFLKCYGMTDTD